MPRNRFLGSVTGLTIAAMVGVGLLSSSAAQASTDTASDNALEALEAAAPQVLETSLEIRPSGSALGAATATSEVSLPLSTDEPVEFSSKGVDISIVLPVPDAEVVSHDGGAAVYREVDGVTTVISPQEDAGVLVATILQDESAASRFDYAL